VELTLIGSKVNPTNAHSHFACPSQGLLWCRQPEGSHWQKNIQQR